jgi:Periplasmic component of the Tol biopolymer transport system
MIMAASCAQEPGSRPGDDKIIGRADLKIEDGILTPEILHQLGKVSDPQVSPDGKRIIYGVGFTSIEENRTNREIFIMNADGSDNKQITKTAKSESNARWTADGKRIAFLYNGQIWNMSPSCTVALAPSFFIATPFCLFSHSPAMPQRNKS